MNIFNRNKTKWIPLGRFVFSSNEYITFVRGNNKTGMLDFKTKQVNFVPFTGQCINPILPTTIIDSKIAWETIIKMTNE